MPVSVDDLIGHGPFDFYSERYPNMRFRGDVPWLDCGLEGNLRTHLHRCQFEIVRGRLITEDHIMAYALLNAPKDYDIKPGVWYERLLKERKQEQSAEKPRTWRKRLEQDSL